MTLSVTMTSCFCDVATSDDSAFDQLDKNQLGWLCYKVQFLRVFGRDNVKIL